MRGRVRDLRVKRGDVVEKGAVLFVLDSPELGSSQNDFLEKRVAADTVGPAVAPVINVTSIVALLLLAVLAHQ